MKLFRHIENLTDDVKGAVVAWGNFDGFHKGHQVVMGQTAAIADAAGAPLAALTTEPHPREYFRPEAPPFRLMSLRSKAHILESFGVDVLFVLSFDEALATMSAEDFIRDILVGKLAVSHVVTGYDQRFGKGRTGDTGLLRAMGKEMGFEVTVIEPVCHPDGAGTGEVVYSSTQVRDYLRNGRPEEAAALMGHWWQVEGRVESGDRRGRTIGFPTANLAWDGYLEPALGVYAVWATVEDGDHAGTYAGVANLGMRPTFDKQDLCFEVHLLNFDDDIYGAHMAVDLVSFLRPEKKFDGLEALRNQIGVDRDAATVLLSNIDHSIDRYLPVTRHPLTDN